MENYSERPTDTPPVPRKGLKGVLDKFVGPGATRLELALQFSLATLAAVAAPLYASRVVDDWSVLQYLVCTLLAFDVVGGIVTNATSSAKRWYHRKGQDFPQLFLFVVMHVIHLSIVSWLYLNFDFHWVLVASLYLLAASALILLVPQYIQRAVALSTYVFALLISMYLLTPPLGLEWFLPFFYMKLLVSHLPKEESYKPDK